MLEAIFFRTSPWVVGLLTVLELGLAVEIGFRAGRRRRDRAGRRRSQTTTAQAAVLGLLGLLLAFTFSLSQARFDTRRALVIEEANAIGTTYLRAQMLPSPERERASALLRRYVAARTPAPDAASVQAAIARSERLQDELWSQALDLARGGDPAVTLLFTQSLNDVIDLHAKRVTAYLYRAPAGLLALLHVAAVLAMAVMGYGSGLDDDRNLLPSTAMLALIAVVMLLIVDLEQGHRGLIRLSQRALVDVQRQIDAAPPRVEEPTSGALPTP